MKLHFDNNLDFQQVAISSVVDLFHGQRAVHPDNLKQCLTNDLGQVALSQRVNKQVIENKLHLHPSETLHNLQNIQHQNGLKPSKSLTSNDFTLEMETGTGKTYVYLHTIFELNKKYNFTKFIVVIPSDAIKERTFKTLKNTRDHFENLFPEAKDYEYFQYDPLNLNKINNFIFNSKIEIMLIVVTAINERSFEKHSETDQITKDANFLDLVRSTNPIIIVDSPKIIDGNTTTAEKRTLKVMNPLFTLRYTASHVESFHTIYQLNVAETNERKLVKQIKLASLELENEHIKPYIRLISTQNKRGIITAKIEADFLKNGKIERQFSSVKDGENLGEKTGRNIYRKFRVGTITCGSKDQSMILNIPTKSLLLHPNHQVGGSNTDECKRFLIQQTIKEHLDKEKYFRAQNYNVKVLSLFFIDNLNLYYNPINNEKIAKGKYAVMFEEEFRRLAKHPKYQIPNSEFNLKTCNSHVGYFPINPNGEWTDNTKNSQSKKDDIARAYNLILNDREKLLGFASKQKFIFSHIDLIEAWDNPNIFQICPLSEFGNLPARRQTIKPGIRLCVDQSGHRVERSDINKLNIITTENYKQFSENLQREIELDTGFCISGKVIN